MGLRIVGWRLFWEEKGIWWEVEGTGFVAMAPMVLLLNATKVVGVVGAITVAANALTFRHFYKKNIAPFPDPVDETKEVLAEFPIDKEVEDGGFFFALATAPAHVEDRLDDAWLEFAKAGEPKDNPAGDPPETRTGEKDNAASYSGISLTEEAQAEEIKKGLGRSEAPDVAGTEELSSESGSVKNSDGLGGEWEVLSEKDKLDAESEKADKSSGKLEDAAKAVEETFTEGQKLITEEEKLETMSQKLDPEAPKRPRRVGFQSKSTVEPSLMNVPRRAKKLAKLSMEALIRGFERFTEEEVPHNVAAWHNAIRPEERLRFWSDPDTEIKLAQGTNSTVFRMGVDWSRIMPIEPISGIENAVNWMAVKH